MHFDNLGIYGNHQPIDFGSDDEDSDSNDEIDFMNLAAYTYKRPNLSNAKVAKPHSTYTVNNPVTVHSSGTSSVSSTSTSSSTSSGSHSKTGSGTSTTTTTVTEEPSLWDDLFGDDDDEASNLVLLLI